MASGDLLINTALFQIKQDNLPGLQLNNSNKWAPFKGRSLGKSAPLSEIRVQIKWQHFYYLWLRDHDRASGVSGRRAGAYQGKWRTLQHIIHSNLVTQEQQGLSDKWKRCMDSVGQQSAVLAARPHITSSKHFSPLTERLVSLSSQSVSSDWISILAIMANSNCHSD